MTRFYRFQREAFSLVSVQSIRKRNQLAWGANSPNGKFGTVEVEFVGIGTRSVVLGYGIPAGIDVKSQEGREIWVSWPRGTVKVYVLERYPITDTLMVLR